MAVAEEAEMADSAREVLAEAAVAAAAVMAATVREVLAEAAVAAAAVMAATVGMAVKLVGWEVVGWVVGG